jgi:hypothetical protein
MIKQVSQEKKRFNLWHIMLIVACIMFIAGIAAQYLITKPQDIQVVILLGYSIINRLLRVIVLMFLLCVLIMYFYLEYLHKSLACESDVFRLRKCLTIFQGVLFFIIVASIVQIAITVVDIVKTQHISSAYVLHSKILGYFGYLLFSIWFIAITYKHIKTMRNIPPSVLIAAKGKKDACG